jgi:hypothetical protein
MGWTLRVADSVPTQERHPVAYAPGSKGRGAARSYFATPSL